MPRTRPGAAFPAVWDGRPRAEAAGVAVSRDGIVEAAGGVVARAARRTRAEVLLVHRPKYDDWSLPKGKLEPGETHEAAACREVEEETGWRCALGEELPAVRYMDRQGRPKHVRYWRMTPARFGRVHAERRGRRGPLAFAARSRDTALLRRRPAAAGARVR